MSRIKAMNVLNDNDTTPEVLASSIRKMSDSMQQLLNGPLKYDTIVRLIQQQCGISKGTIHVVIDAMRDAAKFHLKPLK